MDKVTVLYEGYSKWGEGEMVANCSCTLVRNNNNNIIVDTMTSWDTDKIIEGLLKHGLTPQDINYVVSTHGHSDHIGNNNLFLQAKHIVGFSISFRDTYYLHPFDKGVPYKIDDNVEVIATPGHTLSDVTVMVYGDFDIVGITGDLFEKLEDIEDPAIWLDAGSEDPLQQRQNRLKMVMSVDWIIPGHGPKFKVTDKMIELLKTQVADVETSQ